MLKRITSPSITKSSSAAIVYGLSQRPQTMPRTLFPTLLTMKDGLLIPPPKPIHEPATRSGVSFNHGPGGRYPPLPAPPPGAGGPAAPLGAPAPPLPRIGTSRGGNMTIGIGSGSGPRSS